MKLLPRWARLKTVGLLGLVLSLGACDLNPCGGDAAGFADKAQDFFADVKTRRYDATDRAWEAYDERLVELVEVCYPEHDTRLTREQDRKFWRGVSAYYTQRYGKAGAREFWRKLKGGAGDKLREAADAIGQ